MGDVVFKLSLGGESASWMSQEGGPRLSPTKPATTYLRNMGQNLLPGLHVQLLNFVNKLPFPVALRRQHVLMEAFCT